MRLDKYLADMGVGTRSEVKQYIGRKQVLVNGELPSGPQQKVTPGQDSVQYRGKMVSYMEYEYYMLNKPAGYVSAVTDQQCRTVMELITGKKRKDLFPVGRLDKDTEGLLLITNDGELAHNLLAPGKHVPKTYYARICGDVTEEDVRRFAQGLDIGEKKLTLPAALRILSAGSSSEVELIITEGKFHQVKRMFEAVGKKVTYLKRTAMGELHLDTSLIPGAYRPLAGDEITRLKNSPARAGRRPGQTKEKSELC